MDGDGGHSGGDEFTAFVSEADSHGALRLAERIQTHLANHPVELPPANVAVTVGLSIGIAGYPAHGIPVLNLVNKPDRAMYAGKHRITVLEPEAIA